MAIVKVSYFRGGAGAGARLRGSVRYAATRPGSDAQERPAFSRDENTLNRAEAIKVLGETESGYCYRMVLNSGEGQDAQVDLKAWTRDTVGALSEDHGAVTWIAYEHRDHSDHAHVHVVAVTERTLDKEDLQKLRDAASESWARQETWAREAYRDDFNSRTSVTQERSGQNSDRSLEW